MTWGTFLNKLKSQSQPFEKKPRLTVKYSMGPSINDVMSEMEGKTYFWGTFLNKLMSQSHLP